MSWPDFTPLDDSLAVFWLPVVASLLLEEADAVFLTLSELAAPLLELGVSSSPSFSFLGAEAPYSSDALLREAAAPPLAFMPGSAMEKLSTNRGIIQGGAVYHDPPPLLA